MTATYRITTTLTRRSSAFWALGLLLIASFALGGSARGDVASLMLLRPLAVLLLGLGLLRLERRHVTAQKFLCVIALAITALPALQLIPLPPEIWSRLPERSLIEEIDQAAGLGRIWRPLTLTPLETWNALYASLVPLAVVVLGIQLDTDERRSLLPLVLIFGGLSAVLGLLQTQGAPQGPLYFYAITNESAAVGLFANRNHQALLLAMMLPMLAVFAGSGPHRPARKLLAFCAALLILPLILITGSRLGLIAAGLAVLLTPALLWRNAATSLTPRGHPLRPWVIAGLAVLCAGLVALTIGLGRGMAWERLLASGRGDELRLLILPTLFTMIAAYFPAGTGMGSFERIYQLHEPDELLSPIYMNHAHNDWLELLLTGGVAAVLLLALAFAGFAVRARRAFLARGVAPDALPLVRLGLMLILLAGLGSISDYPLRVPSLSVLFAMAALWASCPLPGMRAMSATASN